MKSAKLQSNTLNDGHRRKLLITSCHANRAVPFIRFFYLFLSLSPALLYCAPVPNLSEAIASNQDLYAQAALQQPNGPSYEFFKPLIPALHYVNADFRHYPIIVSAPRAPKKARLVSNGSAVNARANTRAWNEVGTPALFRVGNDEMPFGEYLQRLEGPK